MRHLRSLTISAAILLALGAGSAQAAVVFSDNFNGEQIGIPATSLANFNIAGSIDVIGEGSAYDLFPGNGRYLDLDGTAATGATPASTLTSKTLFGPGTYTVSFNLGGSQRGDADNTTTVSLGNGNFAQTLSSAAGLGLYSFTATVVGAPSALTFVESGPSDNIGNILDNVTVSSVPLPASAPMFGAALLALAGFGYGLNRWVAPKGKKEAAAA